MRSGREGGRERAYTKSEWELSKLVKTYARRFLYPISNPTETLIFATRKLRKLFNLSELRVTR